MKRTFLALTLTLFGGCALFTNTKDTSVKIAIDCETKAVNDLKNEIEAQVVSYIVTIKDVKDLESKLEGLAKSTSEDALSCAIAEAQTKINERSPALLSRNQHGG